MRSPALAGGGPPAVGVIVCAYNEAHYLGACLHSLRAQTRPPDELVVIDNASDDGTGDVAGSVPGVRVVREPQRGLVLARERGRRETGADLLVYLDADCRAPLFWLERIVGLFGRRPSLVAASGPYRYYDWDLSGRLLVRAYDWTLAPATHVLAQRVLRMGAILYGGNFAVRREALDRIGGFDVRIDFHGEDTNLARRLCAVGPVALSPACWLYTSARRYRAMGKSRVFRLYARNFWSEVVHHRPSDSDHVDVRI